MPALDNYINSTSMVFWPRFQTLMDAQAESLRRFGVPAGTRRGESVSLGGIPVTVRFASLLEGLLTLSEEEREDEPLVNRYQNSPFQFYFISWHCLGNVLTVQPWTCEE